MWIFGYGSLVWRPAFPYRERRAARLAGYLRRFWQGSPDHRGTPDAPGRVVTLVEARGAEVWGMAYELEEDGRAEILGTLDVREKAGYQRLSLPVSFVGGGGATALVYIGGPDNPSYLGPASLDGIADHVRRSCGPSGHNVEYVIRLADALTELSAPPDDTHALAALLR